MNKNESESLMSLHPYQYSIHLKGNGREHTTASSLMKSKTRFAIFTRKVEASAAYRWPCLTSSVLNWVKFCGGEAGHGPDTDMICWDERLTVTSEASGNNVTKAMNSSQPAFMLIGFEEPLRRVSAPSCRALASSNDVSARKGGQDGY